MNAQTEYLLQDGPAGQIEVAIDRPEGTPLGVAVIAHPHPLHGGTLTNKVVQTLARAFVLAGWTAVRFNFRGVGRSEGTYDEGRGELDDLLTVVRAQAPDGPLCLSGFSFGAFVTSHAAAHLQAQRDIQRLFQEPDLLAHGPLRDVQLFRRKREAEVLGRHLKGRQCAQ